MKKRLIGALIIIAILFAYPQLKSGITVTSKESEEELITTIGRTLRLGDISLIGKRVEVKINGKDDEGTLKVTYVITRGGKTSSGDVMDFEVDKNYKGEFTTLIEYEDLGGKESLGLYFDVSDETGGQATVIVLPNFLYKSDRFTSGGGSTKYDLLDEFIIYETAGRGEDEKDPWSFVILGKLE